MKGSKFQMLMWTAMSNGENYQHNFPRTAAISWMYLFFCCWQNNSSGSPTPKPKVYTRTRQSGEETVSESKHWQLSGSALSIAGSAIFSPVCGFHIEHRRETLATASTRPHGVSRHAWLHISGTWKVRMDPSATESTVW